MRDGHNKKYCNLKSVTGLEIALLFLEIEKAEIVLNVSVKYAAVCLCMTFPPWEESHLPRDGNTIYCT